MKKVMHNNNKEEKEMISGKTNWKKVKSHKKNCVEMNPERMKEVMTNI